jgi:hypothetical protein
LKVRPTTFLSTGSLKKMSMPPKFTFGNCLAILAVASVMRKPTAKIGLYPALARFVRFVS